MKIIPFIVHTPTPSFIGFELVKIELFLQQKGTTVWETEKEDSSKPVSTIVQEYLIDNGLLGDIICVKDNCIYYKINSSLTNVKNFYTYLDSSLEQDSDVWRSFYYIPGEEWKWNALGENLMLKNFGSITKIWDTIFP